MFKGVKIIYVFFHDFVRTVLKMNENAESDTDNDIPLEETLLLCARRGQANIISDVLKSKKEGKIEVDINCKGRTDKVVKRWNNGILKMRNLF